MLHKLEWKLKHGIERFEKRSISHGNITWKNRVPRDTMMVW